MSRMQQYFGTNHGTPAHLGALWATTPVGRECYCCEEPIGKGDDGWIRPYGENAPELPEGVKWTMRPIHRECDLLGIVGHLVGVCLCTAEDDEYNSMSTRDMARECLKRWNNYVLAGE